jgi:hypothetical protein
MLKSTDFSSPLNLPSRVITGLTLPGFRVPIEELMQSNATHQRYTTGDPLR